MNPRGVFQESTTLANGRHVAFTVRYSPKARAARLRIGASLGLELVVPAGFEAHRVRTIVASRAEWIETRLTAIEAIQKRRNNPAATLPDVIALPAQGETWTVEYRRSPLAGSMARTAASGKILVYGKDQGTRACLTALRRWLARRAADTLPEQVLAIAAEVGHKPRAILIKSQRTRWGSCATSGRISLNSRLLFLPPDLVRYVMIHELCHLIEPNHSSRFWACVRCHDDGADAHHAQMREAWRLIPDWASPVTTSLL